MRPIIDADQQARIQAVFDAANPTNLVVGDLLKKRLLSGGSLPQEVQRKQPENLQASNGCNGKFGGDIGFVPSKTEPAHSEEKPTGVKMLNTLQVVSSGAVYYFDVRRDLSAISAEEERVKEKDERRSTRDSSQGSCQ